MSGAACDLPISPAALERIAQEWRDEFMLNQWLNSEVYVPLAVCERLRLREIAALCEGRA